MDDVDRAKDREMEHRELSLEATQAAPDKNPGEQQHVDKQGRVLCLDCDDVIPIKRLVAKPDAVRCIYCKEDWERNQK